jgi:hypothetical protein
MKRLILILILSLVMMSCKKHKICECYNKEMGNIMLTDITECETPNNSCSDLNDGINVSCREV